MKFTSTRHNSPLVSLAEAIFRPVATDGGLYLPEFIPELPRPVLANMSEMTMEEIGYVILNAFLGKDFEASELKKVAATALNFPSPMLTLPNGITILELFEGPTLSFKDFGARVMGRLLELALRPSEKEKLNIVMATTGNTGSAMASALSGIKNVNVFVVFPRGTAGRALESQFTTLGGNIIPVEVSGTIDDCHAMVATVVNNAELRSRLRILSANSINIARILGQTIYYFYGVSHLADYGTRRFKPVTVSIPAGNLGNLSAGLIAKAMGLEIKSIVAAENANNYLLRALVNEDFEPRPAIPTLAYAADKSVPTNFERILDLCDSDPEKLKESVIPISFTDADIIRIINDCREQYDYLLDPHSALAYGGLLETLRPGKEGLMLATAHPAKSLDAMTAITGRPIDLPLQLTTFMTGRDHRHKIAPSNWGLRRLILDANK